MLAVPLDGSQRVDDEADLVARAQRDRQEFALLYRQYLPHIYRYCYRHLGRQEAAEDATSQIFAQALAALPRYQGGSFRAWLFTIAHHAVIDEMRRTHPASSLDDAASMADGAPSLEDVVIRAEAGRAIAAVMSQLPPAQQQVLELRLAGLTAVEIAAVMNRSHGTIRNLQHRTLVRLRDLLAVRAADGEVTHVS
ncbi:MAG: sigma-70 family RNA polymerase sigma factor [Chloroflexia bacterium]|nr:sigma-70 family RNA polymerase sigma factor [Chloroflexia bacterium]